MISGVSRVTWAQNFANDSSLTSHSRLKVKRANTSWWPSVSQLWSMPSALTRPSRKSRKWS